MYENFHLQHIVNCDNCDRFLRTIKNFFIFRLQLRDLTLDDSTERRKKKKSHKHKKPSPLHSIVRSEIERLFIKILYVLDDNRRSQLV